MNTVNVIKIIITFYLYRRNLTHVKYAKLKREKIALSRSSSRFGTRKNRVFAFEFAFEFRNSNANAKLEKNITVASNIKSEVH